MGRGWGGGGEVAKSYEGEKTWSSTNHFLVLYKILSNLEEIKVVDVFVSQKTIFLPANLGFSAKCRLTNWLVFLFTNGQLDTII